MKEEKNESEKTEANARYADCLSALNDLNVLRRELEALTPYAHGGQLKECLSETIKWTYMQQAATIKSLAQNCHIASGGDS